MSRMNSDILSHEATAFLLKLSFTFEAQRQTLLTCRRIRQGEINNGSMPQFLPETETIRESNWTAAPIPDDLLDRKVEITGPADRKVIINALNSDACAFMADFEDSLSPTWFNVIEGQQNLYDAVRGTIEYTSPERKCYKLAGKRATLSVRPRGWHLDEKHFLAQGRPMSASLFDFGLYFFHNAKLLIECGSGPYFYLPKLESHFEARLWNDVFNFSQDELGIPRGSIRATVLIETVLAAFEMDEIVYELRDHAAGLNCGRWDYIFSFIKKFSMRPEFLLPDRSEVTMDKHFLSSCTKLLVQTCHRRGIHAMGGMAAQIPVRDDPRANESASEAVRQDKLREVQMGHDGTWVAHPGLVQIAKNVFDSGISGKNQINARMPTYCITANDLLAVPRGSITQEGLRRNVEVGIRYLRSWLDGAGCVPINNLMEDAATAEICRAQIWQWVRHKAKMANGVPILPELVERIIEEQRRTLPTSLSGNIAGRRLYRMITSRDFDEFLTLANYDLID